MLCLLTWNATPAHCASYGKRSGEGDGGNWGAGWDIPESGQWDPCIWGEWSSPMGGEIPGETCLWDLIPTFGWGLCGFCSL